MPTTAAAPVRYAVQRLTAPLKLDGKWDAAPWRDTPALHLAHHMGPPPAHRPRVEARLLYDDDAVYAFWRVEDAFVRAVARRTHDSVSRDSCVEFFFSPSAQAGQSYFALETNCGGTLLFARHNLPRADSLLIDPADCALIQIRSSLPPRIEPEQPGPLTWLLQYRLPIRILARYLPVEAPAPGVTWRANFFKCADDSSHPHWLTWAPVPHAQPDFHRPEAFGVIDFL